MRRSIITLMLLLGAAVASQALTLQEARADAEKNYPLLRDFNLIPLTEQYTVENAAKAWLPQVTAGVQATWQTAVAAYPEELKELLAMRGLDLKGMSKFQYKASVEVSQLIWDGGRVEAAKESARAATLEANAGMEVELYGLRERIDGIFFGILLMEQQRLALKASEQLLEANLAKMRSLVKNGAAMPANADAVEVELLSVRQQLTSVDGSIAQYRAVLGVYLGTDGSETLEMPEEIPMPLTNSATLRPEQMLMDARIGVINAREAEINASTKPRVGAFAQGFFGYPGLNFMDAMMTRTPRFGALIGVSASWNISSFYTKKNNLSMLRVNRERIATSREVFDFNVDLQATQQRRELLRLRDISESDAQIVALRERVRQASEARLHQGVVDPTDLLMHITEERNALIQAGTHRIQYLKALYSIQNILNSEK